VRVIDCVLSLRRPDDRPVAPTLEAFERRFPAVESVQQLRALIGNYKSPALFAKDALESSDPARAQMLKALVEYLIRAALATPGPDRELLQAWARKARPQDYLTVQIPGFTLAAFQHLRRLLGANTAAPQVQVNRYIAGVLGRPVSDVQGLLLLEEAAQEAGVDLRDVESSRWEVPTS
jgi:hypothetical protein